MPEDAKTDHEVFREELAETWAGDGCSFGVQAVSHAMGDLDSRVRRADLEFRLDKCCDALEDIARVALLLRDRLKKRRP